MIALYSYAFGSHAAAVFPFDKTLSRHVFSTLIIAVFTAVNFLGAKFVGKTEEVIVGIKVAILLLFSILGLAFFNPQNLDTLRISRT